MVATIFGLIGVAAFIGLALWKKDLWLGAIAVFMLMNCWGGLQHARALLSFAKVPRRDGFHCPSCKSGAADRRLLEVRKLRASLRHLPIRRQSVPLARPSYAETRCLECGNLHPMHDWMVASLAPSKL